MAGYKHRQRSVYVSVTAVILLLISCLCACTDDTPGKPGIAVDGKGDVLELSMFIAMAGSEINEDNEIRQLIAEKTGVIVKESWLTGQTTDEAVNSIIATEAYPDLIDGGDAMVKLYDAGLLVPWDDYIEKYPNLKAYYTEDEWDHFRQDDGHIYWCNVFQNTKNAPTTAIHNDEAFWIQARVLEWAGYPKIETLDEFFDLLERYAEANPLTPDGMKVIPYTCLCEDWKYFCLENAPQFLDGYPNDGSVIVDKSDPDNPKIVDYNTTPTAKRYFKKLNEEYLKGCIDEDFSTQNYEEYINKLSKGNILAMCDQYWNFTEVNDVFKQTGKDLQGCNYVPLGLTIDKGMEQRWHTYGDTLNISSGVGITITNPDIEKTFAFLDAMLDQDIHDLRFWGEKDVDYAVDETGKYYRTDEMRSRCADPSYRAAHMCVYKYLPQYGGTSDDGINANFPEEQTEEFLDSLAPPLKKCFDAYDATSYTAFLGSVEEENAVWFPMWSYSNNMTVATPGGAAWKRMARVKHEWLPKLVMSLDFESDWDAYMEAYEECMPEDFLDEMQTELDRRAGLAK